MKRTKKIFAGLSILLALSMGFSSCDMLTQILEELTETEGSESDNQQKDDEKEDEKPEDNNPVTNPENLPEAVGEDPFAGKTITIGDTEFSMDNSGYTLYIFGTDKTLTIEDHSEVDWDTYDLKIKNKVSADYSYDATKKELYWNTKSITLYTYDYWSSKEPEEETYTSTDKIVEHYVQIIKDDPHYSFEDDESETNYYEYITKQLTNTYNVAFNQIHTLKYTVSKEDPVLIFEEFSYRDYKNDISLDDFSFSCGNYEAATVSINKAKKTFKADDIYSITTSSGEGYSTYDCHKAEGSFEGTYETDSEGKITSVKITKDVYASELEYVLKAIDSIPGRKEWTDREDRTKVISYDTTNKKVTFNGVTCTMIGAKITGNLRAEIILKESDFSLGFGSYLDNWDYPARQVTYSNIHMNGESYYCNVQLEEGAEELHEFISMLKLIVDGDDNRFFYSKGDGYTSIDFDDEYEPTIWRDYNTCLMKGAKKEEKNGNIIFTITVKGKYDDDPDFIIKITMGKRGSLYYPIKYEEDDYIFEYIYD